VADGFGEEMADHLFKDFISELKINHEIDPAAAVGFFCEFPVIVEIFERTFDIFHLNPVIGEGHLRREAFPEHFEADDQIRAQAILCLVIDPDRLAPGQKIRVGRHIQHHVMQLVDAIGKLSDFGKLRHFGAITLRSED